MFALYQSDRSYQDNFVNGPGMGEVNQVCGDAADLPYDFLGYSVNSRL